MSIKDCLIQFVLRGKDELSPEAKKSEEALAALGKEADELGKSFDAAKDAQGLVNSLKSMERSVEQAGKAVERSELQVPAVARIWRQGQRTIVWYGHSGAVDQLAAHRGKPVCSMAALGRNLR